MLSAFHSALLSWPARFALPSLCGVCHGWATQRLCSDCLDRFAPAVPRCERCALEVPAGVTVCGACLVDPPLVDRSIAAVDYAPPWDRLVTAFKFHDALDYGATFAGLMSRALARAPAPAADTLVVPVPVSDTRLRQRGYNQAWELARRVARQAGARADAHLLLRVRDTPHQLTLPPGARVANVRNAFAVEPARLGELRGRRITLVDDVMTTGATAAEIAGVLHAAGAAAVTVCVLARTPRPGASAS